MTLQVNIAMALECYNKLGAIIFKVSEDTRFVQTDGARCIAATSQ